MSAPLPVIIQGLGPIGLRIAEAALNDSFLEVVGAVEINPEMVGKPLSDFVDGAPEVTIRQSVAAARVDSRSDGGILIHCTGSYLDQVSPQIEEALRQDLHVVSTCEELAFAQARHPEIAAGIDVLARRCRAYGCRHRRQSRFPDGRTAGLTLGDLTQHQVGLGQAGARPVAPPRSVPGESGDGHLQGAVGSEARRRWIRTRGAGGIGQTARLPAGLEDRRLATRHGPLRSPGQELVAGTLETLEGSTFDGHTIRLHFEANASVDEEYDEIVVDGTPPLKLRFEGGVFGDDATAASVLRAARVIPHTRRGLMTVLDLPLR